MSAIARAWEAFLAAVVEAQDLVRSGGATEAIQDLLQHARELLAIIDDEIALNGPTLPADMRSGLEALHAQLMAIESGLATSH